MRLFQRAACIWTCITTVEHRLTPKVIPGRPQAAWGVVGDFASKSANLVQGFSDSRDTRGNFSTILGLHRAGERANPQSEFHPLTLTATLFGQNRSFFMTVRIFGLSDMVALQAKEETKMPREMDCRSGHGGHGVQVDLPPDVQRMRYAEELDVQLFAIPFPVCGPNAVFLCCRRRCPLEV